MRPRPLLPSALLAFALVVAVSVAASAAAEAPPTDAAPAAAPAAAPRTMPYKHPDAPALGALPEGVGVAVGQPAPDATLKDADGATVTLRDLYGRGPVLLVFYRGGWCPYCNTQIRDLTEAHPDFAALGVTLAAVSVDAIDQAAKSRAAFTVPFPLLSDPDLAAHTAFNVLNKLDAAEQARLKGFGIDLKGASGRDHHTIAVPSAFLIDARGVVRWAHADADYKRRPSTAQLLAATAQALQGTQTTP